MHNLFSRRQPVFNYWKQFKSGIKFAELLELPLLSLSRFISPMLQKQPTLPTKIIYFNTDTLKYNILHR